MLESAQEVEKERVSGQPLFICFILSRTSPLFQGLSHVLPPVLLPLYLPLGPSLSSWPISNQSSCSAVG